jgi:hypothetical protein
MKFVHIESHVVDGLLEHEVLMILLIQTCLHLLSDSKILPQQNDALFVRLIFFEVFIGLYLLKRNFLISSPFRRSVLRKPSNLSRIAHRYVKRGKLSYHILNFSWCCFFKDLYIVRESRFHLLEINFVIGQFALQRALHFDKFFGEVGIDPLQCVKMFHGFIEAVELAVERSSTSPSAESSSELSESEFAIPGQSSTFNAWHSFCFSPICDTSRTVVPFKYPCITITCLKVPDYVDF